MMFFGIDATGAECKTSLCELSFSNGSCISFDPTYPASIRVQESPPDSILPDLLHLMTTV